MATNGIDISDWSPLPVDLEDALKEIRALRNMLFTERQRIARMVEKAELTRRAVKGSVQAERRQARLETLQEVVDILEANASKDGAQRSIRSLWLTAIEDQ